jgi:hypothetical protein
LRRSQREQGWEKITPPGGVPGDTQAIALDPFQVGTLYVQMHHGGNGGHAATDGIYKSSDCGSTWNRIPGGRNSRDNIQGETNIHYGSIVSIIVDPVEPGVMYIASNYGPAGIWKSTNGGYRLGSDHSQGPLPLPAIQRMVQRAVGRSHRPQAFGRGHAHRMWRRIRTQLPGRNVRWRKDMAFDRCAERHQRTGRRLPPRLEHHGLRQRTERPLRHDENDGPTNPTPTWTTVASGANGGDTGLLAYRAKNGKYYLGSDYGIVSGSSDFATWVNDGAAPHNVVFIIGDGEKLYAATRGGPFYTAPEANPTTWSMLSVSGNPLTLAGRWLLYDKTHHILYSSSWQSGLYRLATQ